MSFGGCRFPKEETLPLHGFAFSLEPRAIGVRPNSGTLGMEGVRIVCIVRRSSCGDSIFGCRQALQAQSPGSLQAYTQSAKVQPLRLDMQPMERAVDHWLRRSIHPSQWSTPKQRIIRGNPAARPTRAHSRLDIPRRPAATMFGMFPGINIPPLIKSPISTARC